MKFKTPLIFLGAIALASITLAFRGQAEEEYIDCPDELDGIELSDSQTAQLWQLEAELHETIDNIMPLSAETEATIEQLEENFESQIETLLSPQQKQQIEQLDSWIEEQEIAIVPEFLEEDDDDFSLSPDQEEKLEAVEEEYEERIQAILTPEQQQQIESFEDQLDEAIEAELPEPTVEQEERIETAEVVFEQGVMQILTPEQLQQWQLNLACEMPED
ncbi:MAG: hypothetical protein F6K42_05650 [Leptolyngbya sp. SIO1D8]|nr:hypothetical protein [Leptolyngbya sp. SIO1D8]